MLWQSKVPQIEVETHKVAAPDVVVPTVDTVRHEALLYTWLAEHKPMVLCGPPGSGKTMTLFSALRALPDMEVCNRPRPSSKNPHIQNEAKCTTVVVKMSFICMRIEKHFHIKGWALDLVLIQRPGETRKWPISKVEEISLALFGLLQRLPSKTIQYTTQRTLPLNKKFSL